MLCVWRMTKLTALLPIVAACAASPVATTTSAQDLQSTACPAGVPAAIAPAADQDLAFALAASGVQEYTCSQTATGYAWVFVAPDAQLYPFHDGAQDEAVGHHFAGPTWEWYEDGSSVVGKKVAAATVDASSIPWLLLVAASHGSADGRMTDVTAIQRLSTSGGNAPATGCDADHVGAAANVPYTASYFFYRTRTGHEAHNAACGR